ncbi:hypothetical protein K1T71_011110 [Dendrolimus kikuchii]|uniref:Uncharacterized protein n=1 Tax=Dendrolimus kikuchii TaxID=765133 RepID=A0ACC1CMW7_9NEOP|nr:hypothetical protein K1T71_011110 [Dendrolimus kikuchii]
MQKGESNVELQRRDLSISIYLFVPLASCRFQYGEDTSPAEQYIPIFENIPTLFEYLLETLEKRPEILENNEANVFKRDTHCVQGKNEDCESNMPLEDNQYCLDLNELNRREIVDYYDETYTTVRHEYGQSNKEIYKRDLEQDGVGCTRQTNEGKSNGEDNLEDEFHNGLSNVELDEVDFNDFYFSYINPEHKLKRSVENFGNTYQDSIRMRKFMLTPEEVAQTALEVEKMLEEYEAKNNRK